MPRRGGGWPRETALPHSRKPTPPRFARLPLPAEGARMIFKETLIKSLPFAVRDSRPHICRAVPLSSSVFHAACALSAPAGHLPLEGKADDTGIPSSKKGGTPPLCTYPLPKYRHPERSRGIFIALPPYAHMHPHSNDTLVLPFSPFPHPRFTGLQKRSLHFGRNDRWKTDSLT